MGMRRFALLALVTACSGKPTPTTVATGPTGASASRQPAAKPAGSGAAGNGIGSAAAPPPSPPQGPASNATLAEVGLEAASLDRSADPCVDFYQFACGGWLRANPIPADRSSWSRFGELDKKNLAALQALAEEAAKRPGDKVGEYYASCVDTSAIEKAGTTAIKPLLAKTQAVKDAKTWFAALTELHKVGIWAVWTATSEAGLDDATKSFTWLDSAGLGLPDRDYYDKPEHAQTLARYQEHVSRMLALAGTAKPEVAAADVVAIESALAKVTKTGVQKRDPAGMNNPHDLKALGKRVKSVDWKAYFKAFGITPSAKVIVGSPAFFAAIDGLRKRFKPAQWASYFTYQLLHDTAFALPKAFDEEDFALWSLVRGTPQQIPRAERCVRSASIWMGELLGKLYVDKHFSPAAKQTTQTLFDAIVKVMSSEIGALTWMSEQTRKTAQAKLAKLVAMIGYPDKWRSYDYALKRDDFAGNMLRAAAAETKRKLAKSGKPYDRGEWYENTFEVDAYYNASANNTALLAGILQPPFFAPERAIAANLGGIGMVIGHELTHGFDDQGAKFDAQGNLKDWWAAADKTQFGTKGKCVADQYATFEVLPKQFINGELTLGENIADLGGVKMAFKAYRSLRKDAAQPIVADGFTEDQVFFLATAQAWCSRERKEEMQRRLTVDPHSPPKFRIYGALRNLPEFAQAFSCAAGTPMRPTQTCSVW
jgi:putative endopeptidase